MTERATADAVIEVTGLRFTRADRVIFDDIDLTVQRGRITAIMGPSGTGKTTLLRLVTGQLRPDAGTVRVNGLDVASLPRARLFELRRSMGMLFQNGALLTDYSVFENVAFPLREHTRLPERLVRSIVLMKLQTVGLRGSASLMPAQLSGGMARRIALARAMVMDPDLLLYDEPFSGLDPISMGVVLRLLRRSNQVLGTTSVVVTHDVREISQIADYCYVIAGGKIAGAGSPTELGHSDSQLVRQFINGDADGPVGFHMPAPDYHAELIGGA